MNPSPYAPRAVAVPVRSVAPVALPAPARAVDLELKVSAPVTGYELPILVLSHGHGPSNHISSFRGYGPVVDFWAAHGFVVIQPTHLDSKVLGLREADTSEAPLYWRSRPRDVSLVLDELDAIEMAMPELRGRMDHNKIAVVGHSMGGHTASLLLGARLTDPLHGSEVDLSDDRILGGAVLAGPGRGGDALSEQAAENYAVFGTTDFSTMATPTLVVAGDNDIGAHLNVVGASWFQDAFTLAPAPKTLLTLVGGEHGLGGIAGYAAAETTDEDLDRVAAVQWLVWAYLRTQLGIDATAWDIARAALEAQPEPRGHISTK